MNDLSFLMDNMDEKDKTVARELHLTNSMSNLYNNTANLLGSFAEGPNPNISNVSNINQSQDLILNESIIPSHLKKELAQKDILHTQSGEKLPPEISTFRNVHRADDRVFRTKPEKGLSRARNRRKKPREADLPEINKVLKSLDDDDKRPF